MILAHELNPPAIVRSVSEFGLRPVMFGTMIYPYNSNGSGNDSVYDAFHREYSGTYTPSTNTPPPAAPQTCSQILNTETLEGHITAGESCSCPPGATQPVCVQPSAYCSSMINQIENTPNGKYEQCVCSSPTSGFPTCTTYYQLCENNLPKYQTQYNTCSCHNPQTTAQPHCISYYQICINNLNAAMASNPNQECYCPDPATASQQQPQCESDYDICEQKAVQEEQNNEQCTCTQTSPTPTCETDYQICEQNAKQYENSNTTCSCSQTSTSPNCCTTTTSQKCTQSQQCNSTVTGYYCPTIGSTKPNGIFCPGQSLSGQTTLSTFESEHNLNFTGNPVSPNFCGGSTPNCVNFSLTSIGSGIFSFNAVIDFPATAQYSQQCSQVTNCTPVTTTTCTTE